jgi:hypothetical protein
MEHGAGDLGIVRYCPLGIRGTYTEDSGKALKQLRTIAMMIRKLSSLAVAKQINSPYVESLMVARDPLALRCRSTIAIPPRGDGVGCLQMSSSGKLGEISSPPSG